MIFWEEEIVDHICYTTGTTRDVAHAMVMSKSFIFIQGWSMGESALNVANRILKEYQIEKDRKSKAIV
jgi:hypothetical protein